MKRILIIIIAVSSILLIVCSKDSNEEPNPNDLRGQVYAAYAYQGGGWPGQDYYDVYWVFRFISSTAVERTAREINYQGRIIGDLDKFTYKLEYPKITFYKEDGAIYNTGTFIDKNTFRTANYKGEITEYVK